MVVKLNNMEKQVRSELKGGKGDIHFLNCVSKDTIPNCRLLSYMTIPPEGSIGEHEHVEETECYVIKSGKGVVIDNGKKIDISAGDVVITGNGDVHSVINTENEDLEILAFIVLNQEAEYENRKRKDDADLCIIVGNALDNAIDGTKDIEGAKKIEISMGVKQGNFLLKVKNTFNPELIKFDNNGKRLRTSKTDKSNHGMGIGLIEETALKYNGLMEITMNENIFCLSVLLYQN